jgi:hypothetical protein
MSEIAWSTTVTSECAFPLPHASRYDSNCMRSILSTLVILLLWIPHAPAQSAVLIGLHVDASDAGNGEHLIAHFSLPFAMARRSSPPIFPT